METAALKSFASIARTLLLREVSARLSVVLSEGSTARVEAAGAVAALERAVSDAGGGEVGRVAVVDRVAYTWFNRVVALRFMDARGFTSVGVVSPVAGRISGQPAVLADAKAGHIDADVVPASTKVRVGALLGGQLTSPDPQGEAYGLLLLAYCRHWNKAMPFMFEADADYTELLMPSDLLAEDSVMARAVTAMSPEVCEDVEVIGWLYQFYIAERKDEVFAGFKKNKKAGPAEIPAATQLFTPHWIVRYLVENSLGRLWLLNHPTSRLQDQMEYYIAPADEETDFLKVISPEELKVIDPACGSGHMLTYAFDLLYAIYEEEGYAPSDIPGQILKNNLYGTEIDPRAGSLAAFALTMKARQRQRTFFAKAVQPNICVLESIRFTADELDGLVSPGGNRADEETFLNQFEYADTFGALIRPDMALVGAIRTHLTLNPPKDLFGLDAHARAENVFTQAEFLAQRYHVVVANPPYMGSGNMNATLSDFLRRNYPRSRSDLFASFIERAHELLQPSGYSAMVTMQSWMFLSSYAKLRAWLLDSWSMKCLVRMGNGVMGIAFGTCATVWKRSNSGSTIAVFDEIELADLLGESPAEFPCPGRSRWKAAGDEFAAIPGNPIAYWMPQSEIAAWSLGIAGDVLRSEGAVKTGNNDMYIRYFWEVVSTSILAGGAWRPHPKGGDFRQWYGNVDSVVNWSASARAHYRSDHIARIPDESVWPMTGITWSSISSGRASFRLLETAEIANNAALFVFPVDATRLYAILAYLNSDFARRFLEVIAPTLNYLVGDVMALPMPPKFENESRLTEIAVEQVELARIGWNGRETSIGYRQNALIGAAPLLRQAVLDAISEIQRRGLRSEALHAEAEALLVDTFGFRTATEPRRVLGAAHPDKVRAAEVRSQITDLISYSIGAMFGRYSIDMPGLVLGNQGDSLGEYLELVPSPSFLPDADNVVPITDGEWFEDDVVSRFRQFLRVAFGDEHFEENLRCIEESLGKDIRSYFLKDFYKDHVQRYKKRPIYWLFSSPKGSFNALIYMHRYTPSTVSTVLNEYLREFQSKLKAELALKERDAIAVADPKARNAAAKETDRLREVLVELNEYEHDVLYPLASRQISIDLDDGVKVNYPKFGTALKKIVGLESAGE